MLRFIGAAVAPSWAVVRTAAGSSASCRLALLLGVGSVLAPGDWVALLCHRCRTTMR
jgi:hypothetical protein